MLEPSSSKSDVPKFELENWRPLRDKERDILNAVIRGATDPHVYRLAIDNCLVRGYKSIEIGSLEVNSDVFWDHAYTAIADAAFRDVDGMPVFVTILGDVAGNIARIDIWRGDGADILGFPDLNKIHLLEPNWNKFEASDLD